MKYAILRFAMKLFVAATACIASASYAAHDPVIMIPGMGGTEANMATMKSNLQSNGWPSNILFTWTDADKMTTNMETSAAAIRDKVDQVLAQTGAQKVVLATWSASTIAGRYYLKNLGGTSKVSQFISFAGPHHGISIWQQCTQAQVACRTQWGPIPNTAWLNALNAGTEVPGSPTVKYLTLRGSADTNATPVDTAILAGADENYLANGLNHFSIITDAGALKKMRDFIVKNESANPGAPRITSCSKSASTNTSATITAAATDDGAIASYRVVLSGPTVINDPAAGNGPSFSKTYTLANGYYSGTVTATDNAGNVSAACSIPQFLVGQPTYSQSVSATVINHYLAGRITVTQYNELGLKYGYNTTITLYLCGTTWTNSISCGPMG